MAEPVTFASLKLPSFCPCCGAEKAPHDDECTLKVDVEKFWSDLNNRWEHNAKLESLEQRVRELRDKVADGIISGPMRDTNNDYDSGACDAEIAVEGALTALLGGQ